MSRILALAVSGPLAFLLCYPLNKLSLSPWRKTKSAHWSEQARLLWPAVVSIQTLRWVIPIIFVIGFLQFLPGANAPFLAAIGFVTAIGSFSSSIPVDRELHPRIPLNSVIRQTAIGFVLSMFHWFVMIAAAIAMPAQAGWTMIGITTGFIAFRLFWSNAGWAWIGRKIGLISEPPERLKRIVSTTAASAGISYAKVWLLRIDSAQALALPNTGELLFTNRILEILNDDELAAVCAHELGHLTESRTVRFVRTLNSFTSLPWIFVNPLTAALGRLGIYLPLLCTIILPRLFLPISQRLEKRADRIAASREPNSGDYARALLKLHENNLIPAVNPGKQHTHPHLYDRVVAAGITPDFPRPQAPATMAWPGYLFSFLLGALISIFALSHYR